jgi:hypothetical protein
MPDENTDQTGRQPGGPTDAPGMYDEPDAGLSLPLPITDDEDRIFNPEPTTLSEATRALLGKNILSGSGDDRPERAPLTRPSTAFERPPGNVYVMPEDTDLDPDGPAKFFASLTGESSDHAPIDAVVRLAREAGMETMQVDEDGEVR